MANFSKTLLDPPAILPDCSPEIAEVIAKVLAILSDAERLGKSSAEKFRQVGILLLKLHKQIGEGATKLIAALLGRSERQVRRYLRMGKTLDPDPDLQWRIICGHYDEMDDPKVSLSREDWCDRCVRIRVQTEGCKACADKRKERRAKQKKTKGPIAFDHQKAWTAANRTEVQFDSLARENGLEQDPDYIEGKQAVITVKAKLEKLEKKLNPS